MEKRRLSLGGQAGTDDANDIIIALRPYNHSQPSRDESDGDEAVLFVGVGIVEDLEVVEAREEELLRLLKGDAVLLLVRAVLARIPGNPRVQVLSVVLTKSMA